MNVGVDEGGREGAPPAVVPAARIGDVARRLRARPTWLWRDLAPTRQEVWSPLVYGRSLRLWLALRRGGYTMIGCRRGRTLHRLARAVERTGVRGAIVDCGVFNGGSTVLLSTGAPSRCVWAFDSFEGLPRPGPLDEGASAEWIGEGDCRGSEEKVRAAFDRFADRSRLRIVKGWFDATLAASVDRVGPIALLHADGDWYESVRLTLETFYPHVSNGGYVVVDDYGFLSGARKATDDFRREFAVVAPLGRVDGNAVCWRKP